MSFSVGSIVGSLVLDDQFTKPLETGTKAATGATKSLSKSFAMAGAAAAAAAAAVFSMAKATANYRDATTKAARSAGVSVKAFSQMRHAAELSGVSMESLAGSFARLQTTGAATELKKIGVELKKTNGEAKTNTELFEEVAEQVKNAGTATEKTRIAVAAFGRSGGKMVSMLELGKEGLQELRLEADALGISFNEKAGLAAEKFNDDLERLGKSIQGARDSFSAAVIEFVNSTGILEALQGAVRTVSSLFNNLSDDTKQMIVTTGAITIGFGLLLGAIAAIKFAFLALAPAIWTALAPLLPFIAAAAALAAGIAFLVVKWDEIDQAMGGFENTVRPIADMFSDIGDAINDMSDIIADAFGSSSIRQIDFVGLAVKGVAMFVILAVDQIRKSVVALKAMGHMALTIGKVVKNIATGNFKAVDEAIAESTKKQKGYSQELLSIKRVTNQKLSRLNNARVKDLAETGKKGGEALKKGFKEEVKEIPKTMIDVASRTQTLASSGVFGVIGQQVAIDLWEPVKVEGESAVAAAKRHSGEISKLSSVMTSNVSAIVSSSIGAMTAMSEAGVAAIESQMQRLDFAGELHMQRMQGRHAAELEELAASEDAKIQTLKDKVAIATEQAEGLEGEARERKLAEIKLMNEKIAAAEKAKEVKMAALKKAQIKKEKDDAKKILAIRSAMEYGAFLAKKRMAIASAKIAFASAIMSAVQAGAAMTAATLGFGLPAAMAMTATLIALAGSTFASSTAAIQSSQYIPPTGLFAEQGGVIQGPRHASGGVNVNAEGGEAFLSRDLTKRMDAMVGRDEQSMRATVQFSQGSIIVNGNMDSSMVDRLSQAVAQRIEQRRF